MYTFLIGMNTISYVDVHFFLLGQIFVTGMYTISCWARYLLQGCKLFLIGPDICYRDVHYFLLGQIFVTGMYSISYGDVKYLLQLYT